MLYTLLNGITLEDGQRTNNRTGYFAVTLHLSYEHASQEYPFSAEITFGRVNVDKSALNINTSQVWKGGKYSDPREAAYVSALFTVDPFGVDKIIHDNGHFDDFPKDLYQLPEGMSLLDAQIIIKNRIEHKSQKQARKPRSLISATRRISQVWPKIYPMLDMNVLSQKYGKNAIVEARNSMTVEEFENAFNVRLT